MNALTQLGDSPSRVLEHSIESTPTCSLCMEHMATDVVTEKFNEPHRDLVNVEHLRKLGNREM